MFQQFLSFTFFKKVEVTPHRRTRRRQPVVLWFPEEFQQSVSDFSRDQYIKWVNDNHGYWDEDYFKLKISIVLHNPENPLHSQFVFPIRKAAYIFQDETQQNQRQTTNIYAASKDQFRQRNCLLSAQSAFPTKLYSNVDNDSGIGFFVHRDDEAVTDLIIEQTRALLLHRWKVKQAKG